MNQPKNSSAVESGTASINTALKWPVEINQNLTDSFSAWHDQGANLVMDFHGSPINPDLVLFSDGNHHMALMEAVQLFEREQSCSIFYLTLPPALLLKFAQAKGLCLGNLCLPIEPNVFIGPDIYLDKLSTRYELLPKEKFASSAGCSVVTRKSESLFEAGSSLDIRSLMASGKRMFISHPKNETASYDVYRQTFINMGIAEGIAESEIMSWLASDLVVLGQDVHHREVPSALVKGQADFSLVYHHLALRYERIFPELEYHNLYSSGTVDVSSLHICTDYFVSTLRDCHGLPKTFYEYMQSAVVAAIYVEHGLLI
ncbi:hypothetical protein MNBD_GAMMA12-2221 [hydrothermal vent metagenome]|uniref:Uncharacterized protein n=1 Tax=hydrothermal vent metagenome TaxID=652676 RepID=A0A3B0YS95_9ZZZZ